MQCLVCNKTLMSKTHIEDELCGTCFYTTNSTHFPDYFPEVEMLEWFRNLVLSRYNDAIKTCTRCKQTFPKTNIYFYKIGIKNYLRSECKNCYKKTSV